MKSTMELPVEVCLGPIERIPPGEGRRFVVEGRPVAVFRGRDDTLYAAQDACPHRDGPLSDGIFGAGQVLCPYHSYRFDLATGACLTDPACRLQTYAARQEGGSIWLALPRPRA